jgi:hypothetical protein
MTGCGRAPWFWSRYTACMLIPRQVVEAAKVGGWSPFGEPYEIERVEHDTIYFGNKEFSHVFSVNDLAMDNTFWQALAESFNWRRRFIVISYGIGGVPESGAIEQWEHEARRFFSLLIAAGDTDAFWQKHLRRRVA